MDLDLRKLRYFAAVAEHLHFGRAARELFIAQPVLSRQVRALEAELGCTLLVRTTRGVRLTATGEQLREEARRLLPAATEAVRRVRETDRGVQRLVVAFSTGLRVSAAIQAFAARRPDVGTDVVPVHWWEADAPLRNGRAQVGLLRRPFDTTGLRTVPVGREPRVACLPAAHPLASRRALTSADLEGVPTLDEASRRTASLEEKFERIASGHGLALVPLSVARAYTGPDLVHLPVTDAAEAEACLAAPAEGGGELVRDFLETASAALLTG